MSIPVSTVPAALAGLQSLVATQVATDSKASQIVLCLGEPGMDLPSDIIQIGTNVRRSVRPQVFMGSFQAQALEEDYDIEVLVSSWSGDADPAAIVNRAYQLVAYVETAVRTDPTLAGVVLEAYPSSTNGGNAEWSGDPVGRLCEITVTVHVTTLN